MPEQRAGGSSDFRIFETDEFAARLAALPGTEASFIRAKLSRLVYPQLRANPYVGPNVRKLRGYTPDTWRYRIGRFRLFFLVDAAERIVFMITVDWRKNAYR